MTATLTAWIKNHKTALIIAAALALALFAYGKYSAVRLNKATQAHIEAITATETRKDEVKSNAQTIRDRQALNDRKIQSAAEKTAGAVPDSLDALIELANSIIRRSNESR